MLDCKFPFVLFCFFLPSGIPGLTWVIYRQLSQKSHSSIFKIFKSASVPLSLRDEIVMAGGGFSLLTTCCSIVLYSRSWFWEWICCFYILLVNCLIQVYCEFQILNINAFLSLRESYQQFVDADNSKSCRKVRQSASL